MRFQTATALSLSLSINYINNDILGTPWDKAFFYFYSCRKNTAKNESQTQTFASALYDAINNVTGDKFKWSTN